MTPEAELQAQDVILSEMQFTRSYIHTVLCVYKHCNYPAR
jgi:hypothetical protein